MREVCTNNCAKCVTDLWELGVPVGAVYRIEALFLHFGESKCVVQLQCVRRVWDKAWSQVNNLVQVLAVVAIVIVRQTIVHLTRALRVANVSDLL